MSIEPLLCGLRLLCHKIRQLKSHLNQRFMAIFQFGCGGDCLTQGKTGDVDICNFCIRAELAEATQTDKLAQLLRPCVHGVVLPVGRHGAGRCA